MKSRGNLPRRRELLAALTMLSEQTPCVQPGRILTGFLFPISEYLVELREYGPVYSTWSVLEGELAEPLEGVSACIGNCSTALEELTDDMTEDFLPVLREYILYSDSMKVSWLLPAHASLFSMY